MTPNSGYTKIRTPSALKDVAGGNEFLNPLQDLRMIVA